MQISFHKLLIVWLACLIFSGCSIPTKGYALIPPPGTTQQKQIADQKECYRLPKSVSQAPLTAEETRRIGNIETGRFFEGGRGHDLSSQHYLLCFLNKNYQLLKMPINWLPVSSCGLLSEYQSAGIEKERLKNLCERPEDKKCSLCQSLK